MIKLTNSLTRQLETFKPQRAGQAGVYSCGPTVYDHVHIGNLRAFIVADLLVRTLKLSGYEVTHVMNITDVDDKMIARSQQEFPDDDPQTARQKLARKYEPVFQNDARQVGIDLSQTKLPSATAEMKGMRQLVDDLLAKQLAYPADDGIYFDLAKYQQQYDYGLLAEVDTSHQRQRVAADEYDKEQATDFALWKAAKPNEPSWDFKSGDIDMPGRPGWHLECSVMSTKYLGQPFDIHTGGVDLKFPHHENEIAQSRASASRGLANYFIHNEHMLVEGVKMSKSRGNIITVENIQTKGFDPLAFRLLVLQSHYGRQQNFTWEALAAAQAWLQKLYAMADRQFQPTASSQEGSGSQLQQRLKGFYDEIASALRDDLDTPRALVHLGELADYIDQTAISAANLDVFRGTLKFIDAALGLELADRADISPAERKLLKQRQAARAHQDYKAADQLRRQLAQAGLALNDTDHGTYWSRLLKK